MSRPRRVWGQQDPGSAPSSTEPQNTGASPSINTPLRTGASLSSNTPLRTSVSPSIDTRAVSQPVANMREQLSDAVSAIIQYIAGLEKPADEDRVRSKQLDFVREYLDDFRRTGVTEHQAAAINNIIRNICKKHGFFFSDAVDEAIYAAKLEGVPNTINTEIAENDLSDITDKDEVAYLVEESLRKEHASAELTNRENKQVALQKAITRVHRKIFNRQVEGSGTNNDSFRLHRLKLLEVYLSSGAKLSDVKLDIVNNMVWSLCYRTSLSLLHTPLSIISYDKYFKHLPREKDFFLTYDTLKGLVGDTTPSSQLNYNEAEIDRRSNEKVDLFINFAKHDYEQLPFLSLKGFK